MKAATKILSMAAYMSIFAIISCGGDDDPSPSDPGSGELAVTGVSSSPIFWGDDMTIDGSGFSTVASENIVRFTGIPPVFDCGLNFTSDGGDIQIVSATATAIRIKVPVKLYGENGYSCGPELANIEVTVGEKKATFNNVKFVGLPFTENFLYHYGWFDHPSVTRIGDSVMIRGGLAGYKARESGYWDKVRLSVDGIDVPIKFRTIGLESGWAFVLPVDKFYQESCSEEPDGWKARKVPFRFSLAGTSKTSSNELYVQYMPERSAGCQACPSRNQIAGGSQNKWIISGNYVSYYKNIVFVPTTCGGSEQHISFLVDSESQVSFQLPLSILDPGCSYSVFIEDECSNTVKLADI